MPAAIVAAATAISASIGGAVAAVTGSIALGGAVAGGVFALAGGAGLGAFVSSWAVVGAAAGAFRKPKIGGVVDGGTQVNFQANPSAGVPLVLGRTGTGGLIVHMTTDGQAHKNAHLLACVVLSLGPVQGLDGFTANGTAVSFAAESATTAPYVGAMDLRFQAGAMAATPFPPPSVPAGTIAEWTDDHTLPGLGAVWWSLNYSAKVYPTGVPKPLWTVIGPAVYDPRQDSTFPGGSGAQRANDPTTWAFAGNDNPFLQGLTWCIGRATNGVRVMGLGIPLASIDVEAFVEGANVAEANGWKVGGVVSSSDAKWDALVAMLQAGSGVPTRLGGQVSCIVDTPRVSLRTVTGADVVGEAVITGTKARRDRFNSAVPRFRSEANGWEIVSGAPVRVATYITEDGGVTRTQEIEFGLVQDKDQAAQLAAYRIVNAREAEPIVLPMKPLYMGFKAGDCLTIDEPELGLNGQKVLITDRRVDPMTMAATLTFRTETDAKHPFALGLTGTAPPTPSLTGIDPAEVAAPEIAHWSAAGGVLAGVSGTMPTLIVLGQDDNPNAVDTLVRYRVHGATDWIFWPSVHIAAVGDAVRIEITGVADGIDYDVEVAYRNARGAVSTWLDLGTHTAGALDAGGTLDTTPPADVSAAPTVAIHQGFDAAGSTFAYLRATWPANTDADLDGYVVEISDGTASTDYFAESNKYELRGLEPGKTYTVKVKAADKSGNLSAAFSGTGSVTVGTIHEGSNLLYDGGFALKAADWTLDSWSVVPNASLGLILTTPANGTHVCTSPESPAAPATNYTLSAIAATSLATAGNCFLDVQWLNAAHALISTSAPVAFLDISTGGFVTGTFTSPAGTAFCRVRIYSSALTLTPPGFAFVYHAKLEAGSTFTGWNDDSTSGALYADGSSINSLKPVDAGATKNTVTRSTTTPGGTPTTGDFWVVLSGTTPVALRQWNGTAWVTPADLTSNGTSLGFLGQQDWATAKITYSGTTPGGTPATGDIWIDTSATPFKMKRYNGSSFVLIAQATTNTNQITDGSNLGLTAAWAFVSGAVAGVNANVSAGFTGQGDFATGRYYHQSTTPSSPQLFSIWVDTSGAYEITKIWNGSAWVVAANNSTGTAGTVLTVTIPSSPSWSGFISSPTVETTSSTGTPTCSGGTGTGRKTFWSIISGDSANISTTSGTGLFAVTLSRLVKIGDSLGGTLRCEVIDDAGNYGFADTTFSFSETH